MRVIGRLPWAIVVAAAVGLAAATIIAWLMARPRVTELKALAAVPRASLASPRSGPAVYPVTVHAVPARKTPRDATVAAYWWWVVELKKGGGCGSNPDTVCSEFVSEKLLLRADGTALVTDIFGDYHGISLLADGRDEWDDRRCRRVPARLRASWWP